MQGLQIYVRSFKMCIHFFVTRVSSCWSDHVLLTRCKDPINSWLTACFLVFFFNTNCMFVCTHWWFCTVIYLWSNFQKMQYILTMKMFILLFLQEKFLEVFWEWKGGGGWFDRKIYACGHVQSNNAVSTPLWMFRNIKVTVTHWESHGTRAKWVCLEE